MIESKEESSAFPEGAAAPVQERRLFEDGRFFHPMEGQILFEKIAPVPEATTEYPFVLLTGRGT